MDATLTTNSASPRVVLDLGDERTAEFKDIGELREWLDSVRDLVAAGEADARFKLLEGRKRNVANAIVNSLRDLLREKVSEAAANAFPEGAVFSGQWSIDVRESIDDPGRFQFSIECPVKALILSLADSICAGTRAAM